MIWLVVACRQAHVDRLDRCLGSLQHDPARTVVVDAACHDRITDDLEPLRVTDGGQDFSLARLWNHGLRWAYDAGATEVAVLSSDVVGHPDSLPSLASCLRGNALTMAGPAHRTGSLILHSDRTQELRVPGGCFMLAAEHLILCDEAYRWWYTDDDAEMQARELGPVGIFTGTGLEFSEPDAGLDTAEKERWAVEDRAYFVAKWGCEPW